MNFQSFICVFTFHLNSTVIFSGTYEKLPLVLLQITSYTSIKKSLKSVKKNVILFKLFSQGFCPLKIKITQIPNRFRLKLFGCKLRAVIRESHIPFPQNTTLSSFAESMFSAVLTLIDTVDSR